MEGRCLVSVVVGAEAEFLALAEASPTGARVGVAIGTAGAGEFVHGPTIASASDGYTRPDEEISAWVWGQAFERLRRGPFPSARGPTEKLLTPEGCAQILSGHLSERMLTVLSPAENKEAPRASHSGAGGRVPYSTTDATCTVCQDYLP